MNELDFRERVDYWIDQFGLENWRTTVKIGDVDPGDHHATASVDTSEFYEEANFHFTTKLLSESVSEIDSVICHELTHVLLRDVQASVTAATNTMSREAGSVAFERFDHAQEGAVDKIARIIARGH